MKTIENISPEMFPAENEEIHKETGESWEEKVFWGFDRVLTKGWPYILGFFALYMVAHIIAALLWGGK